MTNQILIMSLWAVSMFDAGPAYPGQVVLEVCKQEKPPRCISIRAKLSDLEKPGAVDELADHLANQLEKQAK